MPRADDAPILAGSNLKRAIVAGAALLATFDIVDSATDARRLLLAAVKCSPLDLVTNLERKLTTDEARAYADALMRRGSGEPVSRIIGRRGFYGRDFIVTPATLDPRPDSETLIDAALELVAERWPGGKDLEILDIGTGSGCLLATLLAELPQARGIGVDICVDALAVAAENARQIGLGDRCQWVHGRTFANSGRKFSLIISNPPYIATSEIAGLDRDVRLFDPTGALDGGTDGLNVYREIAAEVDRYAAQSSIVILEAGDGQATEIVDIFMPKLEHRGATSVIRSDMARMQRCVAFVLRN